MRACIPAAVCHACWRCNHPLSAQSSLDSACQSCHTWGPNYERLQPIIPLVPTPAKYYFTRFRSMQRQRSASTIAESGALLQGSPSLLPPPQMEGAMRRAGLRYYARCELQMKRADGAEDSGRASRKGGGGRGSRGGGGRGAGRENDAEQGQIKHRGFLTLLASRQKSTSYRCAIPARAKLLDPEG